MFYQTTLLALGLGLAVASGTLLADCKALSSFNGAEVEPQLLSVSKWKSQDSHPGIYRMNASIRLPGNIYMASGTMVKTETPCWEIPVDQPAIFDPSDGEIIFWPDTGHPQTCAIECIMD